MTVLQVIIDILQALAIIMLFNKQHELITGLNKLASWANSIVQAQIKASLKSFGMTTKEDTKRKK